MVLGMVFATIWVCLPVPSTSACASSALSRRSAPNHHYVPYLQKICRLDHQSLTLASVGNAYPVLYVGLRKFGSKHRLVSQCTISAAGLRDDVAIS